MKKILTLLFSVFLLAAATDSFAQTKVKNKPRISRTDHQASRIRLKQQHMLRITDTTGIGLAPTRDSLRKFDVQPKEPALPPQNNPNPHSPNSSIVHPDRPATGTTQTPAATKKKSRK